VLLVETLRGEYNNGGLPKSLLGETLNGETRLGGVLKGLIELGRSFIGDIGEILLGG